MTGTEQTGTEPAGTGQPADPRIPVTVIGGFLGAGKTTLVNHLLRAAPAGRYGVIVNEFGAVGVDGGLIEAVRQDRAGLDLTELTAGCLCCTGQDDLVRALLTLALRDERPQQVLIELSGVADPVPVLRTLLALQLRAAFRVGALVAVADARTLRRTVQETREGARQLAYAGVVVLNKAGDVSEETLSAADDAVRAINPLARVVRAAQGVVDPASLLERRDYDAWQQTDLLGTAPPLSHTPGLSSFVLTLPGPLDPYRWQAFLREYVVSRPAEVLRVKGDLRLHGQPGRVLFQSVRDIWTAERLDDGLGSEQVIPARLVFIGRGLERAEYQAALDACAADLA